MKKPDSQILAAIIGVVGLIIVTAITIIFGKTVIQVVFPSSDTLTSTAVARTTPTNQAPTATPSPTPTLITITKNQDISGSICCGLKIDLKLITIVIDTTEQKSTWNFTLTNNGNPINNVSFTTLVLEDNTGQKHQGGGLASTDRWNMSSGQSIPTYATFDVVHGTNYSLNMAINYGVFQTVTITF